MALRKLYQSDMKAHLRFIWKAAARHIRKTGITVWVLLLLQPVVSLGAETALKKASFCPQWIPQAQFAGYMVALEKGFYREAGLDLTLMVGGPRKTSIRGS